MKYLLIAFITVSLGLTSLAQDTTRTENGYELDYPYVHIKVDTITHISKIYSYYNQKSHFSVNGGKAVVLKKYKKNRDEIESTMTVWREHFVLTVTRRYYKGIYRI